MDQEQRMALEGEIEHHRERISELLATLHDLEDNLKNVQDAPEELTNKADALRMELKGRRAAFTIGSAHLGANTPA
jgi:predicted  nucleic acid-binding Zn-ribbon protein